MNKAGITFEELMRLEELRQKRTGIKPVNYYTERKRIWRKKNKERAKEWERAYYQKHKEEKREYNLKYCKDYREKHREELNKKAKEKAHSRLALYKEILGGKCKHCGSTEDLHFHHVDKTKKKFNISNSLNHKQDKVMKELQKCILLCGPCHRQLHKKMRLQEKLKKEK